LFAVGNLAILSRDAVSFCGSRKSSEFGIAITKNLATELASRGVNVVSGYAAGVDFTAHGSALESGGVTTIVLAEGILHFRPKREIAELITEENALVLSEFIPNTKWAAHYAMQRNRTICALSKAVVLIESGLNGGTFNAGETAQSLGVPLFVIDFEEPPESAEGNRHFLARGAMGLRPSPSGNLDVNPVLESIVGLKEVGLKEVGLKENVALDKGNGSLFPDVPSTKKQRRVRRSAS
jgi:DNA protecting protein DprA